MRAADKGKWPKRILLVVLILLSISYWAHNAIYFRNFNTSSYENLPRNEIKRINDTQPRIVLLWSEWRSGTTFLGEILAKAMNNTFYSYEPIHRWGVNIMTKADKTTLNALRYLNDILHCQWHKYPKQVNYLERGSWWRLWTPYLHQKCKPINSCSNASFVGEVCKSADVHVAKVLRLGLRWVRHLLLDPTLDLRVIYMIRDPRAVLNSRSKVPWCKTPTCKDPAQVCSIMQDDLAEVPALQREFPDRFMFVHYDRMSLNIDENIKKILSFSGLPLSDTIIGRLNENSRIPKGNPRGTMMNSEKHVSMWQELDFEKMNKIQRNCKEVLHRLGLRLYVNKQNYHNHSLPAVLEEVPSLAHF